MKVKQLSRIAAAAALAAVAASAYAQNILVDDFNTPSPAFVGSDPLGGGESLLVTHNLGLPAVATQRRVYQNTTQDDFGSGTSVRVGGSTPTNGVLSVENGSGADSQVRVEWTIGAFSLPPVGPYSLLFSILFSNVGTPAQNTTIDLNFMGSTNFSTTFSVGSSAAVSEFLNLTALQAAAFAQGGTLELVLNGTPAWDLTIDQFSISIPEPTSLALAGLALLGAGVAARRNRKA
jgi:hypothetical protein